MTGASENTHNETGNRAAEAGALWGGRFAIGPSPELQLLSKSTQFDWALAQYDIRGSKAHAVALAAAGYLSAEELTNMHAALDAVSYTHLSHGVGDKPNSVVSMPGSSSLGAFQR